MFLTLAYLFGGLGLFLLAVTLMTEGLKLAAGASLKAILASATGTPLRGLAAGALVTSLVRSSSAVTVATIGFVNAGLLNLTQSLGVVYGANIGTTTTGWLVALVGLDFRIELLAMPLIGIGMLARLAGVERRLGAVGEALAGFGLFFIGIDFLRQAFLEVAAQIDPAAIAPSGLVGLMLYVGLGFLATVATQSSGAAIALTLTAAGGGVLTLDAAAATVIGTNIGTTSTAVIAVVGATANARRVAAAHVLFNLLTGLVALVILPAMLWAVSVSHDLIGVSDAKAFELAAFHTLFNVLGVLMIWPFTGRLAHLLERRFVTRAEALARPQFIDHTVLAAPALALEALDRELARATQLARELIASSYGPATTSLSVMLERRRVLGRLLESIEQFIAALGESRLGQAQAERLAIALRASNYLEDVAGLMQTATDQASQVRAIRLAAVAEKVAAYEAATLAHVARCDPSRSDFDAEGLRLAYAELHNTWHDLKSILLRAAIARQIPLDPLNPALEALRCCLKATEQMTKVAVRLATPESPPEPIGGDALGPAEPPDSQPGPESPIEPNAAPEPGGLGPGHPTAGA